MNFYPRTKAREEEGDKYNELYAELLSSANKLRKMINLDNYPKKVEQDISDAIVYLDCARENLLREIGGEDGIFRVSPQVVKEV